MFFQTYKEIIEADPEFIKNKDEAMMLTLFTQIKQKLESQLTDAEFKNKIKDSINGMDKEFEIFEEALKKEKLRKDAPGLTKQ